MSRQDITIDSKDLDGKVEEILKKYGDDALDVINEVLPAVGKEAAKKLKNPGPYKSQTGKYAKGWTSKTQQGRLATEVIVYNKGEHHGLTQLLEHGHRLLTEDGKWLGYVQSFPHISPVNEWAQKEAIDRITEDLEKL